MMKPFADDSASATIGDLTVENGTDRVVLSGTMELCRNKAGLKHAKALKALVDEIVQAMEAMDDLPAKIASAEPTTTEVENPFA